jgi:hypothetical protein
MRAHPGFCTVINGIAVQLLYLVNADAEDERWRAKKIFVEHEDTIDIDIPVGRLLRPMHG